jgi:MFS family permease
MFTDAVRQHLPGLDSGVMGLSSRLLWSTVSPYSTSQRARSDKCSSHQPRPIYVICLLIYVLSCVGTALCPTNAYWLLTVMRIFQVRARLSRPWVPSIRDWCKLADAD